MLLGADGHFVRSRGNEHRVDGPAYSLPARRKSSAALLAVKRRLGRDPYRLGDVDRIWAVAVIFVKCGS